MMQDLPLAVYDNNQIRQVEQLIMQNKGISIEALMGQAGEAVLSVFRQRWPEASQMTVLIGTGNNGGDGLVAARLAQKQGIVVRVFQVGDLKIDRLSEAAAKARKAWESMGGNIEAFTPQLVPAGILVDALLGTGVKGALAKPFEEAIQWMNASGAPILSIDLPSGLDSNTGYATTAVHATATVVLIALKMGLMTGLSCDYRGELWFENLGYQPEDYASVTPMGLRLVYEDQIRRLPALQPSSHKGIHGHVCVVGGGSCGFSGAVLLAGESALRSGAGLVTVAAAPESVPLLARGPEELMCHPIHGGADLDLLLGRANVIVLGPGLGQTAWSAEIFDRCLATKKSCVIDADGLNILAQHPQKRDNWILTPHPKEAARLLQSTVEAVQADRIAAIRALSAQYGGTIVLKGAGTLISHDPEKIIAVSPEALPALGTAGTGDVLSGLIGGLWAQGLSPAYAAYLGVSVHSSAAQIESAFGERGMLASDLFLHIRGLLSPGKAV